MHLTLISKFAIMYVGGSMEIMRGIGLGITILSLLVWSAGFFPAAVYHEEKKFSRVCIGAAVGGLLLNYLFR
ncbi:MAG: hypothetical protein A2431_03630 [Candidatus Zambryskibacteria bacterium RIFOXYC1_FULL_39_10]|uniref:Uncharacterized protein n=1 Tax=Candidatus Zambryskibacteria bacterium RIFOXYC1_FULL_39_10 TaxID=1802779 RepID=A0A1G2V2T6_9BACT|nr:MAG: hypothetical protein A2431_03630 [Candidatus Zambryskibacteria bacterium RIFOXYC1_FULL_39_10]OHB16653.1 MAG: hypothetical protein A2605_00645 [Candidatus Zambryskibacteria bacterium RIFOXYD1_FULL_39_35]